MIKKIAGAAKKDGSRNEDTEDDRELFISMQVVIEWVSIQLILLSNDRYCLWWSTVRKNQSKNTNEFAFPRMFRA